MTLRRRLLIALLLTLLIALTASSTIVFQLYKSALLTKIDQELSGSLPFLHRRLLQTQQVSPLGTGRATGFGGPGGPAQPPLSLPVDSIAGVIDQNSLAVRTISLFGEQSKIPTLKISPGNIPHPLGQNYFDQIASDGSSYRVLLTEFAPNRPLYFIAIPLAQTDSQLQFLLITEIFTGIAIAGALSIVLLQILKRGLAPLESIADTADQISSGDLSLRVASVSAYSEMLRVGGAINSMLETIESASKERDATEEKLRKFLADASHELRTPLTSIMGYAELFKLGAKNSPSDLETLMSRISKESQKMKVLVEDLLLLARLDEKREVTRKATELAVVASEVCDEFATLNKDRRISFSARGSSQVSGDELLLRQAISNLLTNAVKYTPAGSAIEVEIDEIKSNNTCKLTVSDHGPGLNQKGLEHSFDRFWQEDSSRSNQGVGLGLSIVKGVVEEHSGSVAVHNLSRGGACFEIVLPLYRPPAT
ncbi:MAG: HAMP domain-containing histidine kinase [Acidimicrobiaceae bacterium]|nr:HAMP domain-containing histidine kinase [Acidimicrobiaceae bacterium]